MTCNLGTAERTVRIIIGVGLLLVGFMAALPAWGTAAAYVAGIVALFTAVVGFCPAWKLFGINTCRTKVPEKG